MTLSIWYGLNEKSVLWHVYLFRRKIIQSIDLFFNTTLIKFLSKLVLYIRVVETKNHKNCDFQCGEWERERMWEINYWGWKMMKFFNIEIPKGYIYIYIERGTRNKLKQKKPYNCNRLEPWSNRLQVKL